MNKNVLLIIMIFCYLLPIYYVYYNYNSNNSVSNIICDDNCKNYILFFMFLMGIATLLYEVERNDNYSQILICILLIGIYGLINVNETHIIHYIFAFLVFMAILLFMIRHCYLTNCDSILSFSLFLEIVALFHIIININENIFYGEIFYILNFAFYYLYLHFIDDIPLVV
uniref:Uncharacterized protein n=1 Tax=viral metagenome TaxID=1070528 RepID=A0A6C0I153_9ZZZZ